MFAEMSNEELSGIIKAFVACDNCLNCPCDGVICLAGASNAKEKRKELSIEVARRLIEP